MPEFSMLYSEIRGPDFPTFSGPARGPYGEPVLQAELVIGYVTPLKEINRD